MGKETFGGKYFVPDRVKPDDARAGVTVYRGRGQQAREDTLYAVFCAYAPWTALVGGLIGGAYGFSIPGFVTHCVSATANFVSASGEAIGWTGGEAVLSQPVVENVLSLSETVLHTASEAVLELSETVLHTAGEAVLELSETVLHQPVLEAVLQSSVAGHVGELCAGVGDYVGEVFPHSPLAASAGNALMIWGGIQVGRFVVAVGLGLYEDINASQRDR
jgi:hypothetical protein